MTGRKDDILKGGKKRMRHLDTCNRKEGELTAEESELARTVRCNTEVQ